MARCFPFPPPGFAREDSSNEALILSIKLQRENEKAKSSDRKKEKKREKEEKKKQKGEKSNYAVGTEKQKLVEKLYQDDKYKAVSKDKLYQDDKYRAVSKDKCCLREEDESELLEKSSVTEEHGRPIDLKNASCSSDSTGNSSKRKRPSTPPNSIQSHGNIIRIRLSSSHKADEPSTSGCKKQEINVPLQKREDRSTPSSYSKVVRSCSNLTRTEASIKQKNVIVNIPLDNSNFASTSNATATCQLASSLPEKKIQSKVIKEKLSSHEKMLLKRESQYKKLLESWVLPVIPSELVVDEGDDEDWLFGKKDEERPAKRSRVSDVDISNGDNLLSCASLEMQPLALFLPDVQIYALPFTVPF